MATISKFSRKSHDAYKAVIRLRGVKPFSRTFRLKKDAKAWATVVVQRKFAPMLAQQLIRQCRCELPSS